MNGFLKKEQSYSFIDLPAAESMSKNSGHFPSESGSTLTMTFPVCIKNMQIGNMSCKDLLSVLDLFVLFLPSNTSTEQLFVLFLNIV